MKSTILILAIISFIWIGNTESAWQCPGCCAVGIDLDGNQLCLCNPDCKCKCSLETGCVTSLGFDASLIDSLAWLPLLSLIVYIFFFSIGSETKKNIETRLE